MSLDTLLDPLALSVLVVMAVVFPWSGAWDYRRLVRWNAEKDPDARVRHYNWVAAWEWITAGVFLTWWFCAGRLAAPLGLIPGPSGWQWFAVVVGFVLSAVLVLQMVSITRSQKSLSELRSKLGELKDMIPRNSREQRAYDRVSITAGICEEILYRGLLLAILSAALGTWPAVFISSTLFGLGHSYQGPLGILKTAAVGLVLTMLTLFSGSLFTAMIVHIIMDLASGRIMSAVIKLPADDVANEGVAPSQ